MTATKRPATAKDLAERVGNLEGQVLQLQHVILGFEKGGIRPMKDLLGELVTELRGEVGRFKEPAASSLMLVADDHDA